MTTQSNYVWCADCATHNHYRRTACWRCGTVLAIDYTGWDFDQINADAEHYRRWRRGEVATPFGEEA